MQTTPWFSGREPQTFQKDQELVLWTTHGLQNSFQTSPKILDSWGKEALIRYLDQVLILEKWKKHQNGNAMFQAICFQHSRKARSWEDRHISVWHVFVPFASKFNIRNVNFPPTSLQPDCQNTFPNLPVPTSIPLFKVWGIGAASLHGIPDIPCMLWPCTLRGGWSEGGYTFLSEKTRGVYSLKSEKVTSPHIHKLLRSDSLDCQNSCVQSLVVKAKPEATGARKTLRRTRL